MLLYNICVLLYNIYVYLYHKRKNKALFIFLDLEKYSI
nr:MAG TPA: hypothetical protein [Caudoviricetes sp.]